MLMVKNQVKFVCDVAKLIVFASENGYDLTFGEAWRSPQTQKMYVESGKSKTNKSKHLTRLAIDFNLFVNGKYMTQTKDYEILGEHWKTLDFENVWGGDWGWDGNHFQQGK